MAWHYSEDTVRLTFHLENPAKYSPSQEDLDGWDGDLAAKYAAKLDSAMVSAKIQVTPANRSYIVMLAQMSNGSSAGIQLRNACKYFVNVWQ